MSDLEVCGCPQSERLTEDVTRLRGLLGRVTRDESDRSEREVYGLSRALLDDIYAALEPRPTCKHGRVGQCGECQGGMDAGAIRVGDRFQDTDGDVGTVEGPRDGQRCPAWWLNWERSGRHWDFADDLLHPQKHKRLPPAASETAGPGVEGTAPGPWHWGPDREDAAHSLLDANGNNLVWARQYDDECVVKSPGVAALIADAWKLPSLTVSLEEAGRMLKEVRAELVAERAGVETLRLQLDHERSAYSRQLREVQAERDRALERVAEERAAHELTRQALQACVAEQNGERDLYAKAMERVALLEDRLRDVTAEREEALKGLLKVNDSLTAEAIRAGAAQKDAEAERDRAVVALRNLRGRVTALLPLATRFAEQRHEALARFDMRHTRPFAVCGGCRDARAALDPRSRGDRNANERNDDMKGAKYQHAEAFCLMQYSDGKEVEILWNSRDGVTPFGIRSRDGKREMRHVNWQFDRPAPGHVPKVGDRVFVDLTIEKAREYRRRFTEAHWNNRDYPMSDRWDSVEQAIEELAQSDMGTGGGGAPDILTVTAADVGRFAGTATKGGA
jgi:hypothetical protein